MRIFTVESIKNAILSNIKELENRGETDEKLSLVIAAALAYGELLAEFAELYAEEAMGG